MQTTTNAQTGLLDRLMITKPANDFLNRVATLCDYRGVADVHSLINALKMARYWPVGRQPLQP